MLGIRFSQTNFLPKAKQFGVSIGKTLFGTLADHHLRLWYRTIFSHDSGSIFQFVFGCRNELLSGSLRSKTNIVIANL